MSYRAQVHHLFQLHVDAEFRDAFQADPQGASPGLSRAERRELLKLPVAVAPTPRKEDNHPQGSDSAFLRVGVRSRCQIAMPRTYAALEEVARKDGRSLDADLEQELWRRAGPCPAEFDRDQLLPNASIHWTETARVMQMMNRVFWQFYGYAAYVGTARASAPPYLGGLARFEFDTLARRAALYRRFLPPGPTATVAEPGRPLRWSRYAELVRYGCAIAEERPAARPTGVVFLYNGERLRVFPVSDEVAATLTALGAGMVLDPTPPHARDAVAAFTSLGALEPA
jgi:hypothetical protein